MAKSIPQQVKEEVIRIVDKFNEKHNTFFDISFRGEFAYLSKYQKENEEVASLFREMLAKMMRIPLRKMPPQEIEYIETKLGRLKYEGKMDNWSFSVFKYSSERYDPHEWFFPGAGELDGTIEGALRAGMVIYP